MNGITGKLKAYEFVIILTFVLVLLLVVAVKQFDQLLTCSIFVALFHEFTQCSAKELIFQKRAAPPVST